MKMGPSTTKKADRAERKKKKLTALLEITKLNDKDRYKELANLNNLQDDKLSKPVDEKEDGEIEEGCFDVEGPSRKRYKTNDGQASSYNLPENDVQAGAWIKKVDSNVESEKHENNSMPLDDYLDLKKQLRERKLKLKVIPRVLLNEMGDKAMLSRLYRTPIFISDIQHLIMYSQLGHNSPVKPRWCMVEKYNRVSRTVILLVEEATLYDFVNTESTCPNMSNLDVKVEVVAPYTYGGNLVEELAAVPLSRTQKQLLQKKYGSLRQAEQSSGLVFRILRSIFPITLPPKTRPDHDSLSPKTTPDHPTLPHTDRFPRTELLLSAWQMIEEGYPIPLKGELSDKYASYIMSKDEYAEVTPRSPMWGLDCEMCYTSAKLNELTRVSVVDENLKVVYESLVKPPNKIVDYLTRFSGITKKMMENVTKTLEDVQKDLRKLFPSDVILVGQSLNFDLHALKIIHPYVIDTSVIYNLSGLRPRKSKLSVLASTFLGENIQMGHGHDSVEDSLSSLKLVQLKLANSVEFGDAVLSGVQVDWTRKTSIKECYRNESYHIGDDNLATSLFSHVTRNEKTAAVVGLDDTLAHYETLALAPTFDSHEGEMRVTRLAAEDNEAAIRRTCNEASQHSFTVTHIKLLEGQHDLSHVDAWSGAIMESLEPNALLMVILAGSVKTRSNGVCCLHIKNPFTSNRLQASAARPTRSSCNSV